MPKARVNGISLYYEVKGSGRPLFLVQGFAGSHRSWFFQTRAFSKHYRVVTTDSRGVGATSTIDKPYTLDTLAGDVIGLMDYLEVEQAHVLGMSMGGMIAQELAINYPERVAKLVLASTYTNGDETRAISEDMIKVLNIGENPSEEDIEKVDVVKFMSAISNLSLNSSLYKTIFSSFSKMYARMIGFDALMGQFRAASTCATRDRLSEIQAPTLVICGEEDKIVPPIASEILANEIPNAKLVMFEGGSHSIHLEMRSQFNKEVLDFLNVAN